MITPDIKSKVCISIVWLTIIGSYAITIHAAILSLLKEITYIPFFLIIVSLCLALSVVLNVTNYHNCKVWKAMAYFQLGNVIASIINYSQNTTDNMYNREMLAFSALAFIGEFLLYILSTFFNLITKSLTTVSKESLESIIIDIPQSEVLEECSVCLQTIEERKCQLIKCKHIFHKDCVTIWLQKFSNTCPLCRTDVTININS